MQAIILNESLAAKIEKQRLEAEKKMAEAEKQLHGVSKAASHN